MAFYRGSGGSGSGAITSEPVSIGQGGTGAANAADARTNLGLGTIATQDANNVSITGGTVINITDIAVADGGTGASTASGALANLLPSYASNSGKVLAVNTGATDVEWISPSGAGTVTSVAMTVPTGLQITGSPITASGSLDITYASGYTIPTTAKQGNWDTAYGWGDHAAAGYLDSGDIGNTVQAYDSNLTSFVGTFTLPTTDGTNGQVLTTNGSGTLSFTTAGSGTVTSVDLSVPTGLTVSGNPVTSSGTLAIALATGYSIPTTSSQSNWDTAYTDRLKWDGGSTGLNAATGRTSLGLGTAATTASTDYAPAAKGVTNGDTHDHSGGDGGQIAYSSLSGTPTLGTIASQDSSNVSITGGSISGITDLAVADGGTGASTASGARTNILPSYATNAGKVLAVNTGATDVEWISVGGSGTVTSVDMSVPTGFAISGNPITASGTLALAFASGYSLPTNTSQSNWDTAYSWGNHASAGYLDSGDIGVSVQAYDADLTTWAGKTAPTGTVVGTSDTQTLTSKTLTDPAIIGTILEDVYTISDGAAFEIDPGNGSIQLITLGASRTPKATNFAAGEAVTLMVDDGTAYTLTWTDSTFGGSGVVWKTDAGVAPTLNTTGYTVIVLWKVGTQVYGARVGDA